MKRNFEQFRDNEPHEEEYESPNKMPRTEEETDLLQLVNPNDTCYALFEDKFGSQEKQLHASPFSQTLEPASPITPLVPPATPVVPEVEPTLSSCCSSSMPPEQPQQLVQMEEQPLLQPQPLVHIDEQQVKCPKCTNQFIANCISRANKCPICTSHVATPCTDSASQLFGLYATCKRGHVINQTCLSRTDNKHRKCPITDCQSVLIYTCQQCPLRKSYQRLAQNSHACFKPFGHKK